MLIKNINTKYQNFKLKLLNKIICVKILTCSNHLNRAILLKKGLSVFSQFFNFLIILAIRTFTLFSEYYEHLKSEQT